MRGSILRLALLATAAWCSTVRPGGGGSGVIAGLHGIAPNAPADAPSLPVEVIAGIASFMPVAQQAQLLMDLCVWDLRIGLCFGLESRHPVHFVTALLRRFRIAAIAEQTRTLPTPLQTTLAFALDIATASLRVVAAAGVPEDSPAFRVIRWSEDALTAAEVPLFLHYADMVLEAGDTCWLLVITRRFDGEGFAALFDACIESNNSGLLELITLANISVPIFAQLCCTSFRTLNSAAVTIIDSLPGQHDEAAYFSAILAARRYDVAVRFLSCSCWHRMATEELLEHAGPDADCIFAAMEEMDAGAIDDREIFGFTMLAMVSGREGVIRAAIRRRTVLGTPAFLYSVLGEALPHIDHTVFVEPDVLAHVGPACMLFNAYVAFYSYGQQEAVRSRLCDLISVLRTEHGASWTAAMEHARSSGETLVAMAILYGIVGGDAAVCYAAFTYTIDLEDVESALGTIESMAAGETPLPCDPAKVMRLYVMYALSIDDNAAARLRETSYGDALPAADEGAPEEHPAKRARRNDE